MSTDNSQTPEILAEAAAPEVAQLTPHQVGLVTQWYQTPGRSKDDNAPLVVDKAGGFVWVNRKARRADAAYKRSAKGRAAAAKAKRLNSQADDAKIQALTESGTSPEVI